MSRLDKARETKLNPIRMEFAMNKLCTIPGVDIVKRETMSISFLWKGEVCTLYPYSGWHTGKSITDGRGINNLLNQLK